MSDSDIHEGNPCQSCFTGKNSGLLILFQKFIKTDIMLMCSMFITLVTYVVPLCLDMAISLQSKLHIYANHRFENNSQDRVSVWLILNLLRTFVIEIGSELC